MVDGKHTNRFILVCICNKELKETKKNIEEYYSKLLNEDHVCDVILFCINLPESKEFHKIKVLGNDP